MVIRISYSADGSYLHDSYMSTYLRFRAERWMYWFYNGVYVNYFISVITYWGNKNGSIFYFSIFSGRKVNVLW